jgi:hypothetical protein
VIAPGPRGGSPGTSERSRLLRRRAELAREIADVDERLADLEDERSAPAALEPFSSLSLPVDCYSRDNFHRHAKAIAREHGATAAWKSGKAWLVTRDAWALYRSKGGRIEARGDAIADDATLLARAGLTVVR